MNAPCQICSNTNGNRLYIVREMMLGLRDRHPYLECGRCGCLQLSEVPPDLGRYYPSDYYSLNSAPLAPSPSLAARARRRRDAGNLLGAGGAPGALLGRLFPHRTLAIMGRALGLARRRSGDARILDVGCGAGLLLHLMRQAGARSTLGIDPYLPRDVTHPDGGELRKASLDDVSGPWDLIMFNHSFEHLASPAQVLTRAAGLLAPGGVCAIRVPVASGHAFRRYREDWVQLDAPRHLFLHTPASLGRVADAAGLRIGEVIYDSTAFQFWGSEQYRQDIPLTAPNSYGMDKRRSIFPSTRIAYYRLQARALNAAGRGDQAAFLLRRP